MIQKNRLSIMTQITALALVASMAITGFVPQRVSGMKYSLILALGEAGKVALASMFMSVNDPLTDISRMLAQEILFEDCQPRQHAESVTPVPSLVFVPAAADVAYTGGAGWLPEQGDSVILRSGITSLRIPLLVSAAICCRGAPALSLLSDVGRTVQLFHVLLLLMACLWVSSTGAVCRFLLNMVNPVLIEYRVFLFINNTFRAPAETAVLRRGRPS